jgi:hypothetical protein
MRDQRVRRLNAKIDNIFAIVEASQAGLCVVAHSKKQARQVIHIMIDISAGPSVRATQNKAHSLNATF